MSGGGSGWRWFISFRRRVSSTAARALMSGPIGRSVSSCRPVRIRMSAASAGRRSGSTVFMSATTPAACGQAIDVPDMKSYVRPFSAYALQMSLPGAEMVVYDP